MNTKRTATLSRQAYLAAIVLAAGAVLGAPSNSLADSIYVANYDGGEIIKFTQGGVGSVFASGLDYPAGLAFDSSGNLYSASGATGRILKFTQSGHASLFARTNGTVGLAFDHNGNLFVTDFPGNTICRFTPDGVGSRFAGVYGETTHGLNNPIGLAFDSTGNLYVANHTDNTIEKFTPEGIGSLFASTGLNGPWGLAFDSAGNLYAANSNDNTIEKFTPDGIGSLFASTGLNYPTGLAFDSAGNLYAVNFFNTIERFTSNGFATLFTDTGLDHPEFIAIIPETITPPLTNHPPVALCTNVTVSADSNCLASAAINSGSFDPDGDAITLTQVPPGPYPIGSNNVCLNVTDNHGASNVCCAVVFVLDTTPPIINCPTNIIVTNDPGQCSAVVVFSVQASDCALADITCDNPSGSVFPIGITTVNCIANDALSNTATCSFTVTVRDNEAPLVACRQAPNPSARKIPVSGKNASSGQNPDGYYQLLAKDNCDPNPSIYVQDAASSFVAGPFASGDIVKLMQNPGGTPSSDPGTPPIVANIHLNGDAMVYASDASENLSPDPCVAKISPKPKAD